MISLLALFLAVGAAFALRGLTSVPRGARAAAAVGLGLAAVSVVLFLS